jgi:hypothetical protein
MDMAFKVTGSFSAEIELPEPERNHLVKQAIEMALARDQGEDGAQVLGFNFNGKEWKVVVSVGRRWVKVLSKEELERAESEGQQS